MGNVELINIINKKLLIFFSEINLHVLKSGNLSEWVLLNATLKLRKHC